MYIPDDDIVQLSSSIDRAFDIQEVYGLDLAQPSLCSRIESDSVHGQGMYTESPTVLRYGTLWKLLCHCSAWTSSRAMSQTHCPLQPQVHHGCTIAALICLLLPSSTCGHGSHLALQAVTSRMLLSYFTYVCVQLIIENSPHVS